MYKYLFFDLDNTLLDFDLAEDIALTQLLEEQNVEDIESYKSYYLPMNRELWHKLDTKELTREYLIKNRFRLLFEHFGRKVDGEYLADRYQYLLGKQGQHLAGAVELLTTLKNKGYKIFAATNGLITIQEDRLKNSEVAKFFDGVFISERLGVQKPDPHFFELVEEEIGNFPKEETLMIGDNLFADVGLAINYGVDSVWYNLKNIERPVALEPTYEVTNYKDLLEIILSK